MRRSRGPPRAPQPRTGRTAPRSPRCVGVAGVTLAQLRCACSARAALPLTGAPDDSCASRSRSAGEVAVTATGDQRAGDSTRRCRASKRFCVPAVAVSIQPGAENMLMAGGTHFRLPTARSAATRHGLVLGRAASRAVGGGFVPTVSLGRASVAPTCTSCSLAHLWASRAVADRSCHRVLACCAQGVPRWPTCRQVRVEPQVGRRDHPAALPARWSGGTSAWKTRPPPSCQHRAQSFGRTRRSRRPTSCATARTSRPRQPTHAPPLHLWLN